MKIEAKYKQKADTNKQPYYDVSVKCLSGEKPFNGQSGFSFDLYCEPFANTIKTFIHGKIIEMLNYSEPKEITINFDYDPETGILEPESLPEIMTFTKSKKKSRKYKK